MVPHRNRLAALDQPRFVSGLLGVAIGAGTLEAVYYLSDAVLIALALLAGRDRYRPRWWAYAITASVAIGLFWAPIPWVTGTFVLRIALLCIVIPWVRTRRFDRDALVLGVTSALIVQALLLLYLIGSPRPAALSLNGSQVGQTGLLLWMITPNGFRNYAPSWGVAIMHLVMSSARAPMGAAVLFAIIARPRKIKVVAIGVAIAFVFVSLLHSPRTVDFDTYEDNLVTRWRLLFGVPERPIDEFPVKERPRLTLQGYGVASYVERTNVTRPHNVPVLMVYEMGVFAVIPFALFAYVCVTRRLPWAVWLTLLALWMFVEEPTGRPEGYYVLAGILVIHYRSVTRRVSPVPISAHRPAVPAMPL